MKKNYSVIAMIMFCSVVSFFLGSAAADQGIQKQDVPAMVCAAMEFSGSYSRMESAFGSFMSEFFKQGLQPAGPAMTLYYNSPEDAAEKGLKWAIAFPVNGKITVNPPLKKVELPSGPALTTVHMGPYPNLGKTHNRMMAHVKKSGLSIKWPLYEQYLNNPQMVKPEELKTRITYPIEK